MGVTIGIRTKALPLVIPFTYKPTWSVGFNLLIMNDLLQLAIKGGYTKKWLATEYNLLSHRGYHIDGEYDTKKEAKENSGRGMMYSRYEAIRNPNYENGK